MKKVKVQCTLVVEVEVPDDADPHFIFEDNGCPGTGVVGAAIDAAILAGDTNSLCWACNLHGENKILEIDGVPVA